MEQSSTNLAQQIDQKVSKRIKKAYLKTTIEIPSVNFDGMDTSIEWEKKLYGGEIDWQMITNKGGLEHTRSTSTDKSGKLETHEEVEKEEE